MKELPKFTEGPWEKDKYGILKCPKGQPIRLWGSGFVHSSRSDETEANNRLTEAALALYMALWAQETLDEMKEEEFFPASDDPRYTPFLEEDKYASPMERNLDLRIKAQQLRAEALKQARGE